MKLSIRLLFHFLPLCLSGKGGLIHLTQQITHCHPHFFLSRHDFRWGLAPVADGSPVAEAAEDGIAAAAAAEKGHPRMECRKEEIISPLDIWSKFWYSDGWLCSQPES